MIELERINVIKWQSGLSKQRPFLWQKAVQKRPFSSDRPWHRQFLVLFGVAKLARNQDHFCFRTNSMLILVAESFISVAFERKLFG